MKRLLSYMKAYRRNVSLAVAFAITGAFFAVLIPQIVSSITTEIEACLSGQMNTEAVIRYSVLAVVFILATFLLGYSQGRLMAGVSVKVTGTIRGELNDKLDRIPVAYFDRTLSGDTISRVTNDVDLLYEAISFPFVSLISDLVLLTGCIVMMLITNAILALTVIVSTLVGLGIAMGIAKAGKPWHTRQQAQLGILNGIVDEDISGHLVIKAFNCEESVCETFDALNEELYEASWKASFSGMVAPYATFSANLSYVVVCIVGAVLLINGIAGTDLPSIVAFILYTKMFSSPLTEMAGFFGTIQRAIAGADRVFALLDEAEMDMPVRPAGSEEARPAAQRPQVVGDVVFSHVRFGYDPDRPIIHDFSKSVAHGQKIAIVGQTGAGKSTLVNLLMRYYELGGGKITIDGVDIRDMDRRALHDRLCIVPQETWLFDGTLRDNIVYSSKDVSEQRLAETIEACGLSHFVATLPDGLDTVLSERTAISAGQRQLVTIARAMIRNAPILILDEATSSVDTRSEILIQKALDALTRDKTSFVIAHRLSTIRNADEIFVLKDGDIVETGTHEALLAANGAYAELYNAQFDN